MHHQRLYLLLVFVLLLLCRPEQNCFSISLKTSINSAVVATTNHPQPCAHHALSLSTSSLTLLLPRKASFLPPRRRRFRARATAPGGRDEDKGRVAGGRGVYGVGRRIRTRDLTIIYSKSVTSSTIALSIKSFLFFPPFLFSPIAFRKCTYHVFTLSLQNPNSIWG